MRDCEGVPPSHTQWHHLQTQGDPKCHPSLRELPHGWDGHFVPGLEEAEHGGFHTKGARPWHGDHGRSGLEYILEVCLEGFKEGVECRGALMHHLLPDG